MARRTVTVLTVTDDLNGSTEHIKTVTFAIDGQEYEVDLGPKNMKAFKRDLYPWAKVASRTKARLTRVDSLGAGLQSTAMYLLACHGHRAMPNVAVFADTGAEPQYVYDHLDRLEAYGKTHGGPPITRVSAGSLIEDTFTKASVSPPLWVKKVDGQMRPGGRWCTDKYKTRPINKFLREFAEVPRGATRPYVQVSLGISTDEAIRMKDSRQPWMTYYHPLLHDRHEPGGLGMSRTDCIEFLASVGWGDTPKSACHFCPYHNDALWAEIKELDPTGFQTAVDFDERARNGTRPGRDERGATYFVHKSGVPLKDVLLPLYVPGAGHGGVGCSPYSCAGDDIAASPA